MKKRIWSLFFSAVMLMTAFCAFNMPAQAEEAETEPAAAAQEEEAAETEPALTVQAEEAAEEPVLTEQAIMLDEVRLVGVTAPAIGVEPDYTGVTVPEGVHYTLNDNGARWYNATDKHWMMGGEVFEGGKDYQLEVCFVPAPGYDFEELKYMEFFAEGVDDETYSITMTTAWDANLRPANRSVTMYFNRVPTAHFSDVTDPGQFYYDPVYWAANKGVVMGWPDGTFRPNNYCNRASVVTFLWRLAGRPEPEGMATFSDMTGNPEFDKAISWVSGEYIVTGWADNTFRPWVNCNRAAVVTFLWRMAGRPDPNPENPVTFSDMTGNADFDKAIRWAASYGIVTGWADGTFRPWETCRRLAVASFLYRYAQGGWIE